MTARNVNSWMPYLLGPIALQTDGEEVDVPRRATINLLGATVEDDPDEERTNINLRILDSPIVVGTATHQGTNATTQSIPGEVSTSSTTPTLIASYEMADETLVRFDFIAWAVSRTSATKGGSWSGHVTYRRTSGGAPQIVGAVVYDTAQETTAADDVAFDVSSNTVELLVTAADSDPRNWACEFVWREILST